MDIEIMRSVIAQNGEAARGPLPLPPPLESQNEVNSAAQGVPDFIENEGISSGISIGVRARSSLRQRYEAEARVIERRLGGLESVREKLGLSQRKIAQLLLVDPSAWTRWTQETGGGAPPHIWRTLAWYLALQDKYPALDASFWLQGVARAADGDRISENADAIRAQKLQVRSLEMKIRELSIEIESLKSHPAPVSIASGDGETVQTDAEKRAQTETRAIANFFLAVTFAALGYAISVFFAK